MAAHFFDEDLVAAPAAGASPEQNIGIAFVLLSVAMVVGQLVFLQRFVNRMKTFPPAN